MSAPWTHSRDNDVKDPINLSLTGTDLTSVIDDLKQAQWQPPLSFGGRLLATDQYLHFSDQKKVQNEHRVKMRVGLVFQYHVRLWQMEEHIKGSAHLEILTPLGGHKVLSFERAEKEFADDLKSLGWTIDYDNENLGNYLQDPPNNGFATKIMR